MRLTVLCVVPHKAAGATIRAHGSVGIDNIHPFPQRLHGRPLRCEELGLDHHQHDAPGDVLYCVSSVTRGWGQSWPPVDLLVLERIPCSRSRVEAGSHVQCGAALEWRWDVKIWQPELQEPGCSSGKPFRPGGPLGHPGRWIRSCCCRRAPGSLSSTSSFAMRSCTSRSA